MGISGKIGEFASQVQDGMKASSVSLLGLTVKTITAFVLGMTFAMIGQEILGYQTLSFVFIFVIVAAVVFRFTAKWTAGAVLIFDLICVLVGLLLRMYILWAP